MKKETALLAIVTAVIMGCRAPTEQQHTAEERIQPYSWGEVKEKVVDGRRELVQPVAFQVESKRIPEWWSTNTGFCRSNPVDKSCTGSYLGWGLMGIDQFIGTYRAMLILNELEEIDSSHTISDAWYVGNKEPFFSEEQENRALKEIEKSVGYDRLKEILTEVPPNLDELLTKEGRRGTLPSKEEIKREITLGNLQPTTKIQEYLNAAD